jgi:cytochrome c556
MQTLFLSLAFCAVPFAFAADDPSPQHVKWMKATDALQQKIRDNQDVAASAQSLAALYKEIEGFWGKRSEVGAKTTKDIQAGATALAAAATASDAAGVASARKIIGGGCRGCHDQHREKASDGVYKIK